MAEDSKNDIPAINRSIGTVMKAMEKLKNLVFFATSVTACPYLALFIPMDGKLWKIWF